jgi:hypothetical protein
MARGLPGADSFSQVTPDLIQAATDIFGSTPQFWGRYFKSPTGGSAAEYHHGTEDPVLAQANFRVLPVAQQTGHVNGSQALGAADAQLNVADILATFPQANLIAQGGQFLMFLDVEGVSAQAPSLSLAYYTGWAQTLVSFSQSETNNGITILPCVYARQLDNVTWNTLNTANANGIPCHGAWVARYPGGCNARDYQPLFAHPPVPLPFDVLIWQYAENCNNKTIDLNQTNPNIADIQTALLNKLILPPTGN